MSRAKVNPYQKRVAASVSRQYVIEAKELHMSLSTYIAWLKQRAGYTTKYDNLIEEYESQQANAKPDDASGGKPSGGFYNSAG